MICPNCKADSLKVVKVQKFETVNFRVIQCESCFHSWTTEEVLLSERRVKPRPVSMSKTA